MRESVVVEIDFSINTKQYKVQRGIKPSIFNITVDGVELHKEADDRAMQKILEAKYTETEL